MGQQWNFFNNQQGENRDPPPHSWTYPSNEAGSSKTGKKKREHDEVHQIYEQVTRKRSSSGESIGVPTTNTSVYPATKRSRGLSDATAFNINANAPVFGGHWG